MKGVICAGGRGSRLHPLTKVTNKHLLPVGTAPMICHPLRTLVSAGVTQIEIVVGGSSVGDILRLVGSGNHLNANVTYRYQEEPLGIAHAIGITRDFVGNDKFIVILGDNIIEDNLLKELEAFRQQPAGTARIMLKKVPNPHEFGILMTADKPCKMVEKPSTPAGNDAVTGIYMFDATVFEVIQNLVPSERGEFEIADVINHYLQRGTIGWSYLQGYWYDAGTFSGYAEANAALRAAAT